MITLPVVQEPKTLVDCTSCGKCCTYVSIAINSPTSARNATDILWYLYHDKVSVYVDGDGDWSVVFETRCRNLQDDLRCGIYSERPHICRDFDNQTCEVNSPEGGRSFEDPKAFLEYLKVERPRLHRRLAKQFVPAPAV